MKTKKTYVDSAQTASCHFTSTTQADSAPASRRRFIQQATLSSAAVLSSWLSGCGGGDSAAEAQGAASQPLVESAANFMHGVASGDPLQDRVIIWTRVTPEKDSTRAVRVIWQLAADPGFAQVLQTGSVETSREVDFTVKVDVTGLAAGQIYFYRFLTSNAVSPAGRTKTLPGAGVAVIKLAVFSCSCLQFGYFNTYADAAKQASEFDAALHLGDFFYEYGARVLPGFVSDRAPVPPHDLVSLQDYRQRHGQYRADPDLQALAASLPLIAVWDDHEIANDAYVDGAQNHDSATQGPWIERKRAAQRAYFEWMPIRAQLDQPIYRSFDFGDLLSLHMLDTRLEGRTQQLNFFDYVETDGRIDGQRLSQAAADPARRMISDQQFNWLQQQMQASSAKWQVLGQQILMAPSLLPAPVMQFRLSPTDYLALKQIDPATLNAEQVALLNAPLIPMGIDSWNGYITQREALFAMSRSLQKNLVVLAGDSHNSWGSQLKDQQGQVVGVEFGCPASASPGWDTIFPGATPEQVAAGLMQLLPATRYVQTSQRGYLVVTVNAQECKAEWRHVDTVKSRNYKVTVNGAVRTVFSSNGALDLVVA